MITANRRTGISIRMVLTLQDLNAVISLSCDIRPNAIMLDTSIPIGIATTTIHAIFNKMASIIVVKVSPFPMNLYRSLISIFDNMRNMITKNPKRNGKMCLFIIYLGIISIIVTKPYYILI